MLPRQTSAERRMRVAVNLTWDWERVFSMATNGLLGGLADQLEVGGEERPNGPKLWDSCRKGTGLPGVSRPDSSYEADLLLVSFGERPVFHSEVLAWGQREGFGPASVRETFAIPATDACFYRGLGIRGENPPPQSFDACSATVDLSGWTGPLSVVCTETWHVVSHAVFGIKCLDHGDFDFFSYWPFVDFRRTDDWCYKPCRDSEAMRNWPKDRLWFAFVLGIRSGHLGWLS
jgi:hypothetical protein